MMVTIATFKRVQPIRAQSCRRRFSIVTRYAILPSSVEQLDRDAFRAPQQHKGNFREMNSQSSRNETAATAVNGSDSAAGSRDRKSGGSVLKRLKSRRNQVDRRPVTEEELRALGRDITPDEVLGLRAVARGKRSMKPASSRNSSEALSLHMSQITASTEFMCLLK